MRVRYIDRSTGLVEVNNAGRDLSYRLHFGVFSVSYTTNRKDKNGRKVRMHRILDAHGHKAAEIKKILETNY